MDAREYINSNYKPLQEISPRNFARLAESKVDGRFYVIKFLKAYDNDVYKALARYKGEGVCRVFETFDSPDGLYVIEEYIDGCNIAQYFEYRRYGDFPAEQALVNLISQLCQALNNLHSMTPPIIHRDIKPENIMISKNGNVKLIDFNISRQYSGGSSRDTFAMGTSNFAAPEQYGFRESDPRTDIYGMGATTKFLMEKYNIYSDRLNDFVEKATAFDPQNRFVDALQAVTYLNDYYRIKAEEKKREKEELGKTSWRRFLPPGFRTGNPSHMIIGGLGYFFLCSFFYFSFVNIASWDETKMYSRGEYILALVIFNLWVILITLFSCNYLGVQKYFGNIDKLQGKAKVKAIIGMDVIIFLVVMMLGVMVIKYL